MKINAEAERLISITMAQGYTRAQAAQYRINEFISGKADKVEWKMSNATYAELMAMFEYFSEIVRLNHGT